MSNHAADLAAAMRAVVEQVNSRRLDDAMAGGAAGAVPVGIYHLKPNTGGNITTTSAAHTEYTGR